MTHDSKSSSERSRKFMNVTVHFLDDSSHVFQLQAKNLGQVLFDKVCKFINLIEVDYFGLEFEDDKNSKCWLDVLKPLCSQISTSFPSMHFCVKFYTPDPVQLEDEFTRYLFGLQVKKDLASGSMQCNDNTAAVMISYVVQADYGDFSQENCDQYLSSFKFVPSQDADLERKVMENHKKIAGQTPAEADLNLLETARRCELYGIKMTAAKDQEGVPLNLAVAHSGVLVFQNYTKINTFSWAKIRKLSFKRRKFLIKLHPEGYGYYKDTVEFFFEGRNECKTFWKKCIENHTFFRCTDAKHGMRQRPKIFSRGSSFRYSGRTQKQVSEYVRENCVKRPPFQRSTSLRAPPTSPSRSAGGTSPQPLLPLTSISMGSIRDAATTPVNSVTNDETESHTKTVEKVENNNNLQSGEEMDWSSSDLPENDRNRLSGENRSISSDSDNCNVLHDSQQNFETSTFYVSSPYAVRLANKKKSLCDKTYCLAKELLMTERTYRKDLEIVNVVFRDEFSKTGGSSEAVARLLSSIDPLYERHCSLLRDLEQRIAFWEGRPSNRNFVGLKGVADVLLAHKDMVQVHRAYVGGLPSTLDLLRCELEEEADFASFYRSFEGGKACHLPLASFLLKAAFRLPYYHNILKDLLDCYNVQHEDYKSCVDMLVELKTPCEDFDNRILPLVNYVKLLELQRCLIGIPGLVHKDREFVREGSLFKLSENGSQQHMFFLFSDLLVYASRVHRGRQILFRVQGRVPTSGLRVEPSPPLHGVPHCISLMHTEKRHLVAGAHCGREMELWARDLGEGGCCDPLPLLPPAGEEEETTNDDVAHVNTSVHICWHRNISVCRNDLLNSMKHCMSGYLLRKFKNSSGWQKVWVVLANLCLFFYRSYLDESPLASLPLAGYRISGTSPGDLVHGELVFKLLFKNHEYFFTVENRHTFDRWMEAVGICTLTQDEKTHL